MHPQFHTEVSLEGGLVPKLKQKPDILCSVQTYKQSSLRFENVILNCNWPYRGSF
jgi:hypothetical protein